MRANPLSLRRAGVATLGLAALAAVPQAQQEIVLIGQTLEDALMNPIGTVTQLRLVATSESGSLVELDTTATSTTDELVWDGLGVALREGDAVSDPAGATVLDVECMRVNNAGDQAYSLFLSGVPSAEREALYLNGTKLLQEGESATVAGLPAGSFFVDFDAIQLSNQDGGGNVYVLAYAEVNDGGVLLDTLLLIQASSAGVVASIDAVLTEGDVFDESMDVLCPQPVQTIRSIDPGPNRLDVTENGSWIVGARLTGVSATDYCVILDGEIVAREGCASPTGDNWLNLLTPEVGIRGGGGTPDWVVAGTIAGGTAGNLLIVKTGATFVRKGDVLAATNGAGLGNFGNGPVSIADDGDVLWYGEWIDPDPELGAAIFKGVTPVVQKGQTMIDLAQVDNINDLENSYGFSPGGERVIFTGDLDDGRDGAWSIGAGTPWSIVSAGCGGSAGTLTHTSGTAIVGDGFNLRMDNGQVNNVLTLLFFANNAITPGFDPQVDCGFAWSTFGELVLSVAPPNPVFVPAIFPPALWASGSPVDYFVDLTIPQDPSGLVGLTFYFQGVFLDTMNLAPPAQKYRLTNAQAVTFGSL